MKKFLMSDRLNPWSMHPVFLSAAAVCAAFFCIQKWGFCLQSFCVFIFLVILAAVSCSDRDNRKIPDILIAALLITGILSVPLFPETSLLQRGAGALCISLPMLLTALIVPGGFGGGDVKLMASCGWFLGIWLTLQAFTAAILAAGAYCICMLAAGNMNRSSQFALGPFLCFGIALAILFL